MPLAIDEHVVRLEVPVHQVLTVRRGQALPGADEQLQDLRPGSCLLFQPRAETRSVDELHRDEQLAARLAHLVHRDHVGMGELGQRLGLAEQPGVVVLLHPRVGVRMQDLDRNLAIELRIPGRVHDPHRPRAELVPQHEPPHPDLALVLPRTSAGAAR